MVALVVLVFCVSVGSAFADGEGTSFEENLPVGGQNVPAAPLTNPEEAVGLRGGDLDRDETLELLSGVFEQQIEAPAGQFDDLQVERFLADNVAVIPSGENGLDTPPGEESDNLLLTSSLPLRTEAKSGEKEEVDLSLSNTGGVLEPLNPLAEVEIPGELGAGIFLPEVGIRINLDDAPQERAPSVIEGTTAVYPTVAADTDFAVAPTPTGVETLTQIQTPDAPRSHSYTLTMPDGANLAEANNGGAEVRLGDTVLLGIAPPTAIDLQGENVPVQMNVQGNSLAVEVAPNSSTSFPILVDPLFQTYEWLAKGNHDGVYFNGLHEQWHAPGTIGSNWLQNYSVPFTYMPLTSGMQGLYVASTGSAKVNDEASWKYTVPRYFSDYSAYGERPTSFISHMTLSNLVWQAHGSYPSPYLWSALLDQNNAAVSLLSHRGDVGHSLNDMNYQYQFPNPNGNPEVKVAMVGLRATETRPSGGQRVYVGTGSVQLADNATPTIAVNTTPSPWLHATAAPLGFTAIDTGLGIYAVVVSDKQTPERSWKTKHGCVGVGGNACPRKWKSTDVGPPSVGYDPAVLPTGINYLKVVAEDPVGNTSPPAYAEIRVDHAAPDLALSGPLTEQSKIGTTAPEYLLSYAASDGDKASPLAAATVGSVGTTNGKFQRPQGVALDGEGNIWVVDRNNYRVQKFDKDGKFLLQFGSQGTGVGKFTDPRGIAVSSNGTVWVSDIANGKVQAFSSTGTYIRQLSFNQPYGVATGPGGRLWVSEVGTSRVYRLQEDGSGMSYVYGTPANPTGSANLPYPVGLATDSAGGVWVADPVNDRVQKFDVNGKFVTQFGVSGTGAGQLDGTLYIAVARSGNLLVTDEFSNRVQVFRPDGTFLRQFGTTGSGSGQFTEVRGIAINKANEAFIADAGNNRVHRWTHADLDTQSGVVSTEVKIDGQAAEPKHTPGCGTDTCAVSRTWTLKASNYASGTHNVEVTATDGAGLSTTKALTISTVKDVAGPQLSAPSPIFTAPEGWLEQKNYSYVIAASDTPYGVTSLSFKIDGKVVNSKAQSCPGGGCGAVLMSSVDIAAYEGGAHSAELVATDAGGNTTTKKWIMNVSPEGVVSKAEAEDTLEAVEETSDANPIGPAAEEAEYFGTTTGLGVENDDGVLTATGSAVPTTFQSDPDSGITLDVLPDGSLGNTCEEGMSTPEEQTEPVPEAEEAGGAEDLCEPEEAAESTNFVLEDAEIVPTGLSGSATTNSLVSDTATISTNTGPHVDLIARPLYEGALTFQAIRDAKAPESYSWEVDIAPGQGLVQIDERHAVVYYASGHPAFSIDAQPAHDAIGAAVNTSLAVSGNTVTLTVHHRVPNIVYPVLSGMGWHGGFVSTVVEKPKDETELQEERERIEREEQEAREAEEEGAVVTGVEQTDRYGAISVKAEGPPVPVASASGVDFEWEKYTHAKKFNFRECYYEQPPIPTPEARASALDEAITECKNNFGWRRLDAKLSVHGWFRTNQFIRRVWILKGNLHCDKWGHAIPAMVDCEKRPDHPVKEGEAITVLGDYRFWPGDGIPFAQPWGGPGVSACVTVKGAIAYGEGTMARDPVVSSARQGTQCSWP